MAVNTHKIFLIFLMLNLLIGLAATIHANPTGFSNNEIGNKMTTTEETKDIYYDRDKLDTVESDSTQQQENTFGNIVLMGSSLWNILKIGLNPFADIPWTTNSTIEEIFMIIISMFRWALYPITVIEIYMVIKNRKST